MTTFLMSKLIKSTLDDPPLDGQRIGLNINSCLTIYNFILSIAKSLRRFGRKRISNGTQIKYRDLKSTRNIETKKSQGLSNKVT